MARRISVLGVFFFLFSSVPAFAAEGNIRVKVAPVPPSLTATVQFTEPSGNNILDAEETGKLIITVRNRGKGDAFDVRAEIASAASIAGLEFDREVAIGTVPAGGEVRKEVALKASEEIPTAHAGLTVEIKEANGFDPNPMKMSFKTKAFEPPKLVIADIGVSDQKGSGRIEPGSIVELTVRVQNIGHGDARDVVAEVQTGKNAFVAGESATRFELGGIPSGQFKDFKFSFYTNNRIADGGKIPVSVRLNEARPRYNNADQPLNLVMNAPQKKLEEVIVKGDDSGLRADIQLAGGLSVDVDTNIPEGRKAGKYDVAVVIGNRNYAASGSPNVEFANRDAQIMKDYMVRTMGYDPEMILYAEDATLSKFNEFFGSERNPKGKLYRFVREGISQVFVYYVGHGAPDLETNEAYFVPVDANPQDLKSNGYRLQTFYDNLAKVPAKKMTIVLDSCFSGNSDKGLLFKDISPAMVKVKKQYRGPSNAVLMTSAAVDQVSTWYREKKHSLFTYYFLKGLQGEADADHDGKITVAEMDAYLKDNVPYMARKLSGQEQHPVVTGNASDVVAVLKK